VQVRQQTGNRQARDGVAAHHPSDPLEVLLEVLVTVAIAIRNRDAAVVRPQQCCHAQRQSPGKFSLHCHVQGLHCLYYLNPSFKSHLSSLFGTAVCAVAKHSGDAAVWRVPASLLCTTAAAWTADPARPCKQPFEFRTCTMYTIHIQASTCMLYSRFQTCLFCCLCHSQARQ